MGRGLTLALCHDNLPATCHAMGGEGHNGQEMSRKNPFNSRIRNSQFCMGWRYSPAATRATGFRRRGYFCGERALDFLLARSAYRGSKRGKGLHASGHAYLSSQYMHSAELCAALLNSREAWTSGGALSNGMWQKPQRAK